MKLEPGNTYLVRLIPNLKDINKTFFYHVQHGWNSFATGQYVSALSLPKGEYDPIGQTRYKLLYKSNNDADKVKGAEIKRTEKWLANVLVVDDPINKQNNGKVMILRFGKQLHKIIEDAMKETEDYGDRIFDLSERGCKHEYQSGETRRISILRQQPFHHTQGNRGSGYQKAGANLRKRF